MTSTSDLNDQLVDRVLEIPLLTKCNISRIVFGNGSCNTPTTFLSTSMKQLLMCSCIFLAISMTYWRNLFLNYTAVPSHPLCLDNLSHFYIWRKSSAPFFVKQLSPIALLLNLMHRDCKNISTEKGVTVMSEKGV